MLYEAFRDSLIDIENHGFPVLPPDGASGAADRDRLLDLVRDVDRYFGEYFRHEPMKLVVVGDEDMQSAFNSVTVHGEAVIGRIRGDHTDTPSRDLGQIVWPLVKEAMSGVIEDALRELEASAGRGQITSGLVAVARKARTGDLSTLLVEDDYHLRGSITGPTRSPVITPELDVREVIDDAVDAIIEEVLQAGGNVVFTPSGSLSGRDRIVLLPRS
jgi:hypothetical protein